MADTRRSFKIPPMTDATGGAAYPQGMYQVEVTGIEVEAENRFSDAERVRFEMAVVYAYQTTDKARLRELMTEGSPLCTWANLLFTPRSRLREIAEALMRRTYAAGETPGDLDVLIGQRAIVSVVKHVKTLGQNAGEETTKVGAFQALGEDEVDPETDQHAAGRRPPSAGDRVMASAEEVSGRPPRPQPREATDELDAFDGPNKAPRARENAPPYTANPPGATDPELTRKLTAARNRAPY